MLFEYLHTRQIGSILLFEEKKGEKPQQIILANYGVTQGRIKHCIIYFSLFRIIIIINRKLFYCLNCFGVKINVKKKKTTRMLLQ